jgi:hypothetical protein
MRCERRYKDFCAAKAPRIVEAGGVKMLMNARRYASSLPAKIDAELRGYIPVYSYTLDWR